MKRASPETMRRVLVMVEAYKSAGIAFVPMPILGDGQFLCVEASRRLEILLNEIKKEEQES